MNATTDFRKVTVNNGVGLYDVMGQSHDKLYPHSRREYSRPFSSYQTNHDENMPAKFRDALLSFGEDFLGDPFYFNLDLNKPAPYFSPTSWDEDAIFKFSKTLDYAKLVNNVSEDVGRAYEALIQQVENNKGVPNRKYNRAVLKQALETIWVNDWMIDPRLTVAEKIFFHFPHSLNCEFGSLNRPEEIERFRDSMAWLAIPTNADRVAKAFLYSRMAQHWGETDPKVLLQVNEIHEALKSDITSSYAPKGVGREAGGLVAVFRDIFEDEKIKTLRDSWPTIASDHQWIRSGDFARYAASYAAKTTPSLQPL